MSSQENPKRINVLQVILSLEMGGSETFVVNIAKKIDKRLFNIYVCCIREGGILQKKLDENNIPYFFLHHQGRFTPVTAWRLSRLIRRLNIDVIHSHHLGPLIYSYLAKLFAGQGYIVHTEHSYDYLKENRKHFNIARYLFGKLNVIVGVCDDVTSFIRNEMHIDTSKAITITNGIDTEIFNTLDKTTIEEKRKEIGIYNDAFVIGTVGRLELVKNHDLLLNAFKSVLPSIPKAHLLIVGDGSRKAELEKMSQRLNISQHVTFLGLCNEIPHILNVMDVFVLPSFTEGMSFALLEALAAKKAVIASSVGGNKNIISHGRNGLLVSSTSQEELTAAIVTLYKNSSLRDALAAEGRHIAQEKYSLNRMVEAYQELYLNCNAYGR